MRVLLINLHRDAGSLTGPYRRLFTPMHPITLAYLAAALDEAGIDVAVHDDGVARGNPGALREALRTTRPTVVGISVISPMAAELPRVVAMVRAERPEARIVLGNLHAELFAAELLRDGQADVIVHGEGEITLVELVRELSRPRPDPSNVRGISFLCDAEVVRTPDRPFVHDLDTLPFPAWHKFSLDRYGIFPFARVRDPGILVLGSRGCPFRCSYCAMKTMGNRRRQRSAGNLADEFEHLLARFGIRQPSFVDSLFPLTRKEGLAFAAELIRRGLHREQVWITETRADLVDAELLEALRESGLRRIMFGFESADDDSLDRVSKGVRADAAEKAVRACRRAGVEVIGFFMIGFPGQHVSGILKTIRMARELDLDFAKFTTFVPYPGTEVYEQLVTSGAMPRVTDWRRYSVYPTRANPPVYVPPGLTADEIIFFQRWANLSFYLRPRMAARQLFQVRTLRPAEILSGLAAVVGGTVRIR